MSKIDIEISDDIAFVKKVPKINWSFLVGSIIKTKLEEIAKMQRIISKSKLTEADVDELSEDINNSLSKRY